MAEKKYTTFNDFYPYYLSEHRNGTCRFCHFVGSGLVISVIITSIVTSNAWLAAVLPLAGYGPAWIGHFVFEKNRPATFKYPGYSLAADWVMMKDIITGKIPLFGDLPEEHYKDILESA